MPFFVAMMSTFGYAFYWMSNGHLDSFPAKDVYVAAKEAGIAPGRVAREMIPLTPLLLVDTASVLKPSTLEYYLVVLCLIFGVVVSKIIYNQDLKKINQG